MPSAYAPAVIVHFPPEPPPFSPIKLDDGWPERVEEQSLLLFVWRHVFYTQALLHTDAFTHKHFYTNTFTHKHFHTQTLLHTDALTHRRFYTQTLLHTETFTHRPFYTQTFLHTDAFTHRHFYTQTLLHTDPFTHRRFLHTDALTHKHIYTQTHLHTEAFTHRRFYTQTVLASSIEEALAKGCRWQQTFWLDASRKTIRSSDHGCTSWEASRPGEPGAPLLGYQSNWVAKPETLP